MRNDASPDLKIVLIGPMSAGKSTVAALLAEKLDLPRLEMGELRWELYRQAGYDDQVAREVYSKEGILGVLSYSKPFEAFAVASLVSRPEEFVLDLGAGHSVYEDDERFMQVKRALDLLPYVFLLLPSADLEHSIEVLNTRFAELLLREVGEIDEALLELNEHYVRHPSNLRLAKKVFYTDGRSADETCNEIIAFVLSKPNL